MIHDDVLPDDFLQRQLNQIQQHPGDGNFANGYEDDWYNSLPKGE